MDKIHEIDDDLRQQHNVCWHDVGTTKTEFVMTLTHSRKRFNITYLVYQAPNRYYFWWGDTKHTFPTLRDAMLAALRLDEQGEHNESG